MEFDTAGFPTTQLRCQWCDLYHTGFCSRVKAIEYHPNGSIKRVEFHEYSYSVGDITIRGNYDTGHVLEPNDSCAPSSP